jgi:cell division protein FtsI (penicillin-binding protein 3)
MAGNTEAHTGSMEGNQQRWRKRFFIVKLVFFAFFVIIMAKLVQYQIVERSKFQSLARKQYEQKFVLPATRGNIYDRNGNVLVSNTILVSFAADPKIIGDNAEAVAEAFARIFGKPKSAYLSKLNEAQEKRFVWLERRVSADIAQRIEAAKLAGVVAINEPKRLYHYDELASALIGFTDIDNNGIAGLEYECNQEMKGTDGSMMMQRDGLGRVRPSADYPRREPVNGSDLVLTMDLTYQSIVDEELKRGVDANKADGGLAVMLNPKTGEILALSVYPNINPNSAGKIDLAVARNRVVTDVFEPGSVFKIVTASAAYENHIITPDQSFNAEHGKMKIALNGKKFRIISDSHEYDRLTFQQGIELSSNIVCAKAGTLIGGERFYRQARDLGFGMISGVDLPGEVRGILRRPSEWSGTSLQTMAYGYEVGVTPLQIACAYAAVANKGILMKPYAVAQVKNAGGTVVRETKSEPIRKVLSQNTIDLLTQAFEGVVERGTGKEVRTQGVRIGGKTGTSRKWVEGKYAENNYTASFVGFFPLDDPQAVLLVMMDNPRTRGYYGGITSGPVFRAIAERVIATSYKYSPTLVAQNEQESSVRAVPDVRMLQPSVAEKMLTGCGLQCRTFGKGAIVARQMPEPGKKVEKGEAVTLVLDEEVSPLKDGSIIVPDVRGMSVRRAMNRLVIDDFDVTLQGSGSVVSQSPAPGQSTSVGSNIVLVCAPHGLPQRAPTTVSVAVK